MRPDLIVLGCVAGKGRQAAPARDLYTSQLWQARRGYADATGCPWQIFSAAHGLILPTLVIEPYEQTFKDRKWRNWRAVVSARAADTIRLAGATRVELHAGEDYLVDLLPELARRGIEATRPVQGLGIGEQLRWYAERTRELHASRSGQLALFI